MPVREGCTGLEVFDLGGLKGFKGLALYEQYLTLAGGKEVVGYAILASALIAATEITRSTSVH